MKTDLLVRLKSTQAALLIGFFFPNPSARASERLSLESYRKAVAAESLKLSSLNAEEQSHELETSQARYLTSPQAFAEYQDSKDKSPNLTPEFSGTERNGDELKVGVQTQTSFGLKPRVFAFTQNQRVLNISSLPNPNLSLKRRGYGLEAELSLWKNAFGKDVRGQAEILKALSNSKLHQARTSRIMFELEADLLYFETAYLKKAVQIQEDLVRQGEKLVAWTRSQEADRLLEPVHVAQALAANQSRKLSLVSLRQQFQTNLLKISQLINKPATEQHALDSIDQITRQIPSPRKTSTEKITLKTFAGTLKAEKMNLELASENFKPDLSLKAQYLTFSNAGRADDSIRCQNPSDCRVLILSVNFTVPLDFSAWQKGAHSAASRAFSLEKALEAEKQNSETEAAQLSLQAQALQEEILSLEKLVQAQEQRLQHERTRQARGRATTFDLILSEQELGESRIALVQAKVRYLSTLAQFKLFEESK